MENTISLYFDVVKYFGNLEITNRPFITHSTKIGIHKSFQTIRVLHIIMYFNFLSTLLFIQ